jgi:hypothetical protein
VLRNGVDREEFKGPPVVLSQLAGMPPPVPEKIVQKRLQLIAAKPYTVETILGTTPRTDNFQ